MQDTMSPEEADAFRAWIRQNQQEVGALFAQWAAAAESATPDALLALVPIHRHESPTFDYVIAAEVPLPWRDAFSASLVARALPVIEGQALCAWAHDWRRWACDEWNRHRWPQRSTTC